MDPRGSTNCLLCAAVIIVEREDCARPSVINVEGKLQTKFFLELWRVHLQFVSLYSVVTQLILNCDNGH